MIAGVTAMEENHYSAFAILEGPNSIMHRIVTKVDLLKCPPAGLLEPPRGNWLTQQQTWRMTVTLIQSQPRPIRWTTKTATA
jgi:hypothetical protein